MNLTMLRIIIFVVTAATSAGEYAALNGMFDQTYYNLMHEDVQPPFGG